MRATGSDALAAMWRADEERGVDPRRFEPATGPPATPAPLLPPMIPPWTDPRDASSYIEPPPVATEENPGPPPRREPVDTGRPPTPRLDQARAWRASQMKAAT